jgi:hypothetical protein
MVQCDVLLISQIRDISSSCVQFLTTVFLHSLFVITSKKFFNSPIFVKLKIVSKEIFKLNQQEDVSLTHHLGPQKIAPVALQAVISRDPASVM